MGLCIFSAIVIIAATALFPIPDTGQTQDNHGIGRCRALSLKGSGRSFPVRANGQLFIIKTDTTVTPKTDRLRTKSPDQRLCSSIRTPKASRRGTPSAKMAMSVVVPPISRAIASSPAPGHSENPHDAGSGTGQDRLHRKFKRLSNYRMYPVGLEDINRDRDALMADESQDLLNESAV